MKQKLSPGDIVTIKHKHKNGVLGVTELEGIFIQIARFESDEGSHFAIEVDVLWPYSGTYNKMFFDVKTKDLYAYPAEWFIKM